MEALISVCIPAYNGSTYLKECLDSVIGQTYPHFEVIVVDDQSSDDTVKIVGEYASRDKRISLFLNEQNLGLVPNWNRCIELANGDWIKFIFQDDYLEPDCLELMVKAGSGRKSLVVCNREYILEKGLTEYMKKMYRMAPATIEQRIKTGKENRFLTPTEVSNLTAENIALNFIGEPSVVMFHRSLVEQLGKVDTRFRQICDLEYSLRIATCYGLMYIPGNLVHVRVHGNSASSSNHEKIFFNIRFLEPVLMAYTLMCDHAYVAFRKQISFWNTIRIKIYFIVRFYEARQASVGSPGYETAFKEFIIRYPEIFEKLKMSVQIKVILALVKVRRYITNRFFLKS